MFAVVKKNKRWSFPFMYVARIETDLSRHEVLILVMDFELRINGAKREEILAAWRAKEAENAEEKENARRRADAASLKTESFEPQTIGGFVANFENHSVISIEETAGVRIDIKQQKKKGASQGGDEEPADDGIDDGDFLPPEPAE